MTQLRYTNIDAISLLIIGFACGFISIGYLLFLALIPADETIFTQLKRLFLHGPMGFYNWWYDYFDHLLNPQCPLEHKTEQIKESIKEPELIVPPAPPQKPQRRTGFIGSNND